MGKEDDKGDDDDAEDDMSPICLWDGECLSRIIFGHFLDFCSLAAKCGFCSLDRACPAHWLLGLFSLASRGLSFKSTSFYFRYTRIELSS